MSASKKGRPNPFTVIVNESVAREIETPEPPREPDRRKPNSGKLIKETFYNLPILICILMDKFFYFFAY